ASSFAGQGFSPGVACLGCGPGESRVEATVSDVILVVLGGPRPAVHLLHAAECLAVLTGGARVNVLAMRTPPGYAALTAEANLTGGLLDVLGEEEQQRVAKLEAVYNSWVDRAEEAPFTARWTSV